MKRKTNRMLFLLMIIAACIVFAPKSAYAKTKVSLPVKDVCTRYDYDDGQYSVSDKTTTHFAYTKQGLLKKTTSNGYTDRVYKYKSGRLASVTSDGAKYAFHYKKGKLVSQKLSQVYEAPSTLINYCKISNNKKGKIRKIQVYDRKYVNADANKDKYYLSEILTYQYSSKGKLRKVVQREATPEKKPIVTVTFDSHGCVKTIDRWDNLYSYSYKRKNGRIISMTLKLNGRKKETHHYTYKSFNVKKAPKSLPFEWNAYYGDNLRLRFYQRWG